MALKANKIIIFLLPFQARIIHLNQPHIHKNASRQDFNDEDDQAADVIYPLGWSTEKIILFGQPLCSSAHFFNTTLFAKQGKEFKQLLPAIQLVQWKGIR